MMMLCLYLRDRFVVMKVYMSATGSQICPKHSNIPSPANFPEHKYSPISCHGFICYSKLDPITQFRGMILLFPVDFELMVLSSQIICADIYEDKLIWKTMGLVNFIMNVSEVYLFKSEKNVIFIIIFVHISYFWMILKIKQYWCIKWKEVVWRKYLQSGCRIYCLTCE